jgi:ElaB/YqjD/DUF883 family membrane-anchored ribosome-binding protein
MAATGRQSAAARAEAANEDLARQIGILREELSKLSAEFDRSRQRSASAARQAATDGMESLRAQGEVAYERLREEAAELETQVMRRVREKPVTSLAIAAGIGFLLAILARR